MVRTGESPRQASQAEAEEAAAKAYFARSFRLNVRSHRWIIICEWALLAMVFLCGLLIDYYIFPILNSSSVTTSSNLQHQMPLIEAAAIAMGTLYLAAMALPYLAWVLVCGMRRIPEELRVALSERALIGQFWGSWIREGMMILFLPRMTMHFVGLLLTAMDGRLWEIDFQNAQNLSRMSDASTYLLTGLMVFSSVCTALAEAAFEALLIWVFIVLSLRMPRPIPQLLLAGCMVIIQLGTLSFSFLFWTKIETIHPFSDPLGQTWAAVQWKLAVIASLVIALIPVFCMGSRAPNRVWQRILESRC